MPINSASIHLLPAFEDNYIYVIEWTDKCAWVIDPGQSKPVEKFLAESGLKLQHIFLTHHHKDHVGGVPALKSHYKATVWGPQHSELSFVDNVVHSGEIKLNEESKPFELHAYPTPGHTLSSICFTLKTNNGAWLFCGDTLFSQSCGRLFEGSPEHMLESLKLIKSLPPELQMCCGHEYTRKNLLFAIENLDWKRKELQEKLMRLKTPSLPVSLAEEFRLNPFLNCKDSPIKKSLGLPESASELDTFTKLRALRDQY